MGSGDDPKHFQIDVDFDCRLPPTPAETIASMWTDVNILKKKILLSQPPQPSPPLPQCPVPRVVTAEKMAMEKERAKQRIESFF